ncbi:MAG: hypothetical protein DI606_16320 [Sphingobium sp.]|uniref:hypothetical protein n=1 Tax=Sphingobium sp. TaxID=1912891 RepID=UPI000DAFB3CD|nr:hypothetical protein [Sphingobium sp.]PZU07646.1 MAG: hypothetical protein DI606_16320 [Sphingobium sp.]
MDGLAAELKQIIDDTCKPETSIFDGLDKWQDRAWLWILMVEAHRDGKDPVMARLAYENGDVSEVDWRTRVERLAPAMAYASEWQAKRAA